MRLPWGSRQGYALSRPPSITAHPELAEGPDEATGRRERRPSTQVGWFDKRRPDLGEGLTTSGTSGLGEHTIALPGDHYLQPGIDAKDARVPDHHPVAARR